MTLNDALAPFLLILPIVDWTATVILMRLTRRERGLTFLTERTFAALMLSGFTTLYALVALNTQLNFIVFDRLGAQEAVRIGVIILGCGPIIWLIAYVRLKQ
jgi:hypothetical protein